MENETKQELIEEKIEQERYEDYLEATQGFVESLALERPKYGRILHR